MPPPVNAALGSRKDSLCYWLGRVGLDESQLGIIDHAPGLVLAESTGPGLAGPGFYGVAACRSG